MSCDFGRQVLMTMSSPSADRTWYAFLRSYAGSPVAATRNTVRRSKSAVKTSIGGLQGSQGHAVCPVQMQDTEVAHPCIRAPPLLVHPLDVFEQVDQHAGHGTSLNMADFVRDERQIDAWQLLRRGPWC